MLFSAGIRRCAGWKINPPSAPLARFVANEPGLFNSSSKLVARLDIRHFQEMTEQITSLGSSNVAQFSQQLVNVPQAGGVGLLHIVLAISSPKSTTTLAARIVEGKLD
jgi:hypothetical protein